MCRAAYQYSLWNLALLYAEFGHVELAKEALEKSQEKAREQQDDICLAVATRYFGFSGARRNREIYNLFSVGCKP